MHKKILVLILILGILLFSVVLVSSHHDGSPYTQIFRSPSDLLGPHITASGGVTEEINRAFPYMSVDPIKSVTLKFTEKKDWIVLYFTAVPPGMETLAFTNIVPETYFGLRGSNYIELDEFFNIIEADFTVETGFDKHDDRGNFYYFWSNKTQSWKNISVPDGTHVHYELGKKIDLSFPKGTDLRKYANLLEYSGGWYPIEIEGKNILVADGLTLVDGSMVSNLLYGSFLQNGTVNYKQNVLSVRNDNEKVLIANPDVDLSSLPNLNRIHQASPLEIQSAPEGKILISFVEGHEILSINEGMKLAMEINRGDKIKIETVEGGLPTISYAGSESGFTNIENGIINLSVTKENVNLIPRELTADETGNFVQEIKYQSVSIEFLPNDSQRIVIDSSNILTVFDKDDEARLSYREEE